MSTRSTIAILKKDGTVEQIAAHWDGGIHHNGVTLLVHYRDAEKVKDLISLGNISSLKKEVHPDTSLPHSLDNKQKGVTTFYGRDRGETGHKPSLYASFEEYLSAGDYQGYDYLFDEKKKKWFTVDPESYYINDLDKMTTEVRPIPLKTLVKKAFDNNEITMPELKEDYLQYEKELKAKKEYNKLHKDLAPQEEPPKKKMKI